MQKGQVSVFRYNPETDSRVYYEEYEFPFEQGMTVLDVAMYIYENFDSTFSFSYSCRNSHCGLCGAKINGKPGLMCRESATQQLTLEPLDNFTVIRDLIVAREEYEKKRDDLRLHLERVGEPEKQPEIVDMQEHHKFKVASRCVECYSCISNCPVLNETKHEYIGPAGIVQMARHAFDPRDELNRELMAYSGGLYNCTTCGKCTEACPHSIAPAHNIQLLRAKLVASGRAPLIVNQLLNMVENTNKLFRRPKGKDSFLESKHGHRPQGKIGLFIGCNIDYDVRLQPIAEAAVKVLLKLDVDLAIPSEQVCCGTPLKEVGAHDQLQDLVIKNVNIFKKAGCEKIITLCSGCGLGLKEIWPEVYAEATGQAMPFVVQDLSEYLLEKSLAKAEMQEIDLKATYHDPCTLKRGQGITAEPRQVLKSIPGLELMEMEEADYCCGGGGGLRAYNVEMSQRIANKRISFFKDLDVDVLITSCPTCIKQLSAGLAKARRRKVKILHLATIVADAIKN